MVQERWPVEHIQGGSRFGSLHTCWERLCAGVRVDVPVVVSGAHAELQTCWVGCRARARVLEKPPAFFPQPRRVPTGGGSCFPAGQVVMAPWGLARGLGRSCVLTRSPERSRHAADTRSREGRAPQSAAVLPGVCRGTVSVPPASCARYRAANAFCRRFLKRWCSQPSCLSE